MDRVRRGVRGVDEDLVPEDQASPAEGEEKDEQQDAEGQFARRSWPGGTSSSFSGWARPQGSSGPSRRMETSVLSQGVIDWPLLSGGKRQQLAPGPTRDHALTAGTRSRADMPRGDAARIRAYAVGLVDDARAAGETGMTVRAGDVRDALELDYRKALINICQVLGTRKLQGEAGVELVARRGPSQGLNSVFEFRLVGGRALPRTPEAVSPVFEAPVNRPEGARPEGRAPLSAWTGGFAGP